MAPYERGSDLLEIAMLREHHGIAMRHPFPHRGTEGAGVRFSR